MKIEQKMEMYRNLAIGLADLLRDKVQSELGETMTFLCTVPLARVQAAEAKRKVEFHFNVDLQCYLIRFLPRDEGEERVRPIP